MYNKHKQSYNKIYNKFYKNSHKNHHNQKIFSNKLIKIHEKRYKKENDKYNYNYDRLCNIDQQSNNQYENKKIN
jgi:hypothetical protein